MARVGGHWLAVSLTEAFAARPVDAGRLQHRLVRTALRRTVGLCMTNHARAAAGDRSSTMARSNIDRS
jgi:hypothetical protein